MKTIYSIIHYLVIIIAITSITPTANADSLDKKDKDLQNIIVKIKMNNPGGDKKESIKDDDKLQQEIMNISTNLKKSLDTNNIQNSKLYYAELTKRSILQFLQSEGYYAAIVDFFIDKNPSEATSQDVITYEITLGQRYIITDIKIINKHNNKTNVSLIDLDKLLIKKGDYAIAQNIIDAAKIIHNEIEDKYCLIKLSITHEAIINHTNNTLEVTYIITAGEEAYIKSISFEGLKSLKSNYVRKVIPIKDGQCFKNKTISEAIIELQKTGLFNTIKPIIPTSPDRDEKIDIKFQLKERKHRTIKTGLRYDTDLGIGATLALEHRNIFGSGENMELKIFGNQKEHSAEITFTKPFFLHDKQNLKLSTSFTKEENKSYDSQEFSIYGGIERYLTKNVTIGAGNRYAYSKIEEHNVNNTLSYDSFPFYITRDTRNNIMDPSSGHLLRAEIEPTFNLSSKNKKQDNNFTLTRLSGTAYLKLTEDETSIIALKATIASIAGAKVEEIPANKRLYVGGAGSIRGYQSKFIGHNHNIITDKLYGKSSLETSIEFRQKITDNIGVVLFLDSGHSYGSTLPDPHDRLQHGAGIGLRYYTSFFGPIRADIAMPINKEKNHKSWQLYIGIGQNF